MLDTPNFVTIWNVFYIFRYSLITDFAEIFSFVVADGFMIHLQIGLRGTGTPPTFFLRPERFPLHWI